MNSGSVFRPLDSQPEDQEPFVYARFVISDTGQAWYVTEGNPDGKDFVFYGLFTRPGTECAWGAFRLSELESLQGRGGALVTLDESFQPGSLTEAIPLNWVEPEVKSSELVRGRSFLDCSL